MKREVNQHPGSTMNIIISITLLLFSTAAVKSWAPLEIQTEEDDDFTPQVKENAFYGIDRSEPFGLKCKACKFIVRKVKAELGRDSSKRNVERALDKVCRKARRWLRSICRKVLRKFKKRLIDPIARGGSSREVCRRAGLC